MRFTISRNLCMIGDVSLLRQIIAMATPTSATNATFGLAVS
ncbi:hypothetical protein [Nostoc sp.]